jgi:hypothetical protein
MRDELFHFRGPVASRLRRDFLRRLNHRRVGVYLLNVLADLARPV